MAVELSFWMILYVFGFVLGVFVASLLVLFHKTYSRHTHNITIILFIMSLMLLDEILDESNLVDTYPILIDVTIAAELLIWPFLLFYIESVSDQRNEYQWKDLLYFMPFAIAILWQVLFIPPPNTDASATLPNGVFPEVFILVVFKMLAALSFLTYILWLLSRRLKQFSLFFSKNKKARFLQKVRQAILFLNALVLLMYISFFSNYFGLSLPGEADRIGSLLITGVFYFFGVLIFKNPQIFQEENYSQSVKNSLAGREKQLIEKLLNLFEETKPYLNEKLTVKDAANRLNLSSQQLSYLINRRLGITFLDFVNTYRVRSFKENIHNDESIRKTLLEVALESGFSGKASFNRIFKDHTGFSPLRIS